MKPIRDVVSRDIIEDLWGAGYTILPRRFYSLDPFEIDPKLIPRDRSYQWFHLVHDQVRFVGTGWAAVPASRHDGWFMPAGHVGDIEVNGLGLFEKPRDEVEQEKAANVKAAHQLVADWAKDAAQIGLSGGIKVDGAEIEVGYDPAVKKEVTSRFKTQSKTIETTTKVPMDMLPHMDEVFAERDRLVAEIMLPDRTLKPGAIADKFYDAIEDDRAAPWWPTLHAIVLPYAVDNVRAKLKEQTND